MTDVDETLPTVAGEAVCGGAGGAVCGGAGGAVAGCGTKERSNAMEATSAAEPLR